MGRLVRYRGIKTCGRTLGLSGSVTRWTAIRASKDAGSLSIAAKGLSGGQDMTDEVMVMATSIRGEESVGRWTSAIA
jgi:hypothetical protein